MSLSELIDDIVTANHILANEGVVDAFGHISARHPEDPNAYLLSRARSPELITAEDIMTFSLDGTPLNDDTRKPYLERFIHGSIYKTRPDVHAVVHSHSRSVVPFSITKTRLRPVVHSCACIGHEVNVWDAQLSFGDTNLLVSSVAMGDDLAKVLGKDRAVLMRGHGSTVVGTSVRGAVYNAVYLEANANLQMKAIALGDITYLTAGEIDTINSRLENALPGEGYGRAWDYWKWRAQEARG
ncbi:class II aldolase/adducin family protein [Neorhizobium sp. DT-125]|uniref:class II aldolase/adducin family protein n=1 Tax=Neorhizobium sp. DT-125 TaxID=3396163 RepID=UPI003F1B47B4